MNTRLTFDSSKIWIDFIRAKAEITQYIKEATGKADIECRLVFWNWNEQYIELGVREKYKDLVEVKGKSLEDIVHEAIRRIGYVDRQENLQLEHLVDTTAEEVLQEQGAPPVDSADEDLASTAAPEAVEDDDEIPF